MKKNIDVVTELMIFYTLRIFVAIFDIWDITVNTEIERCSVEELNELLSHVPSLLVPIIRAWLSYYKGRHNI